MDTAARIPAGLLPAVGRVAVAQAGLRLLVLHGSRARGTSHEWSDWDFAYEAAAGFDVDALLAALADQLHADRIDLVDLTHARALMRHRVARDGVVLFEQTPGQFQAFWLNAVHNWCDLAPVLEPAYDRVLEALQK